MFGLVPKGFIPSEDTGQVLINTEGAQGVSYEQMVQYQQQLGRHRRQGSQRRGVLLQRRSRWCRLDRQYRPYFYETQAALRTTGGVLRGFLD